MVKARKLGVLCPALYYVDLDMSALYMEHISGKSVKELLFTQALDEAGEPSKPVGRPSLTVMRCKEAIGRLLTSALQHLLNPAGFLHHTYASVTTITLPKRMQTRCCEF